MTETVKMLQELIALPSVNPAFLPPGDPHGGEERVAQYLASLARREGLEAELQAIQPGRPNLYVRLAPARRGRPRRRLILAPHLDTVGGEEIPGHLFRPRLHQGRLHGRGACDTKGSVAAQFNALLELARKGHRPAETEILFIGLIDEENNQLGSRAVAQSRLKADLAIVGEPTQLKVVTAHKGDLWLKLETRGKAAHGARPELGRNAVHEMARIIDAIESDYASRLKRKKHPILGHATINVGSVSGGRQPNIVPHACHCLVDRRLLPGETEASATRELRAFLRQRGFRVRLTDIKGVSSRPLETDATLPAVRSLLRARGQRSRVGVDYFSDAGVLGAGGIPCVVFGPGNIAQAHTPDEWIQIAQLETAQRFLLRHLSRLP